MPLVLLLFLAGVIAVLWGILIAWKRQSTKKGIGLPAEGQYWLSFSLMMIAGYNNTCYYPSNFDLQSSLNIQNSSSSKFTLATMGYVSLLVPFVLAYIWFALERDQQEKITEETKFPGGSEGHIY